jgi:Arc/MetJ-type ribon-helix-helix transcriptional regulator
VTARKLYTFAIDADLDEALKALKRRDGVAASEVIRRALRKSLEERGVLKTGRRRAPTRRRP